MDELVLSDKKYISSKRAAEISGYAKDYIGQLARSGKIEATRFGRAWYVLESSLLAHMQADTAPNASQPASQAATTVQKAPLKLHPSFYKPYAFPKTWSSVRYFDDDSELLPVIGKVSSIQSSEITSKTIASSATLDSVDPVLMHNQKLPELATKIDIRKRPVAETPSFDIPKPQFGSPLPAKPPVRALAQRAELNLIPVTGVALATVAVFFVLAGVFMPSAAFYTESSKYTASALEGIFDLFAAFKTSEFVTEGVAAVLGFLNSIGASFWAFFEAGLSFVKDLL